MTDEQQQIAEWIRLACECNGQPNLPGKITVHWSRRFTRRLGDATYYRGLGKGRIRLSVPLWPRASEQERRETVIHEACHIIVAARYRRVPPHGQQWQAAMRACGISPERTHNVDRTGLARELQKFVLLDCPRELLDEKCRVGPRVRQRMRRGVEYRCRSCGLKMDRTVRLVESVPQSWRNS